jgi:hypothetical protein
MARKTIEEQTENLKTYEIKPLKDRVGLLEESQSKIQSVCSSLFSQKLKEEEFQDKVSTLFSKKLKEEEFINKVEDISYKKIEHYVQGKLAWGVIIWVLTIVVTALVQKYFTIF